MTTDKDERIRLHDAAERRSAFVMPEGAIEITDEAISFEVGEGVPFGFAIKPADSTASARESADTAKREAAALIPHVRDGCQYAAEIIARLPGLQPLREGVGESRFRAEIFKLLTETHLDTKFATMCAVVYASDMAMFASRRICLCHWGRLMFMAWRGADRSMPDVPLTDALVDAVANPDPIKKRDAAEYLGRLTEVRELLRQEDAEIERTGSIAATPVHASAPAPIDESEHAAHERIIAAALAAAEDPATAETRRGGLLS